MYLVFFYHIPYFFWAWTANIWLPCSQVIHFFHTFKKSCKFTDMRAYILRIYYVYNTKICFCIWLKLTTFTANKKMRYTAVWSQHTPQAIDSFQPKCLQIPGSKVQNSQLVLVHLAPLKLCAIYTFPKAGQLGYERRPLRSCHLTILNLDFPSNTTTFCISVGEESINV